MCGEANRLLLTVDHIDELGDRYDVKNVQILCANCHMLKNQKKLLEQKGR